MQERKNIVFLSGSMRIKQLPNSVLIKLKDVVEESKGDVSFIVGDAPGVDSAFHKALFNLKVADKVIIYCMNAARNNLYGFQVRAFNTSFNSELHQIEVRDSFGIDPVEVINGVYDDYRFRRTRDYFSIKDRRMRSDCSYAICVWDKRSVGTLNNIKALREQGKEVFVYTV